MNGPARYRKRPVEVDAVQVPPNKDDLELWGRVVGWLAREQVDFHMVDFEGDRAGIDIATLEGTMRANPGDWIIRGVKGEFYPCKPDIFEQTYELDAWADAGPSEPTPTGDIRG